MRFHMDAIVGEQGKHDVERLLPMPLVVSIVTVRHRLQKVVQQAEGSIHIPLLYQYRHLGDSRVSLRRLVRQIMRQETTIQPHPNLLVRQCQLIQLCRFVISLDGDIPALIEQRYDGGHRFCEGIKVLLAHLYGLAKVCRQEFIFSHHIDEIGRCARSEPVIIHFLLGKAIQQAIRIEHIRRWPSEVITVIMVFKLLDGLLPAQFKMLGKSVDVIAHLGQQFLFGDTADTGIRLIHAHVGDIVQLAEDAQLRKLRNARQENEAKQWLAIFQRTVEIAHRIAQDIEFFLLVSHIQQRCIIFIDEHHRLLTSLCCNSFYQVEQTNVRIWRITIYSKPILIFL